MGTVSRTTRQELVAAVGDRYRGANRTEKARILDEFVALSGYHRKHAIRVLRHAPEAPPPPPRRRRLRVYDEAVREALVVLWEASDRVCGKRLRPLLPLLISALENHGHLHLDQGVRQKLLRAGAATLDRLLRPLRLAGETAARRPRPPAVRASIAVRTFGDWGNPPPGYLEVDLVAHGGGSAEGAFAHTLVLTDVASGWTECAALAARESSLVVRAIDGVRTALPFPLRGIDADNGLEFINDVLLRFSLDAGIELTRSRPYHKNDQAWVEQKNGAIVRRMVGYGRLQGLAACEALARLYASTRLFVNFFQPSFKLRSKERIGARVRKDYHAPQTPCARLLASPDVTEAAKERLRAILVTLDPLRLLDEIRAVQRHLALLTAGVNAHLPPSRAPDLDQFLASLATTWRAGEVRPTHAPPAKSSRWWRTREDPLEAVWPRVVLWLEADPDRTAKGMLEQLLTEPNAAVHANVLRTLQRRVRAWRRAAAARLVFAPGGDRPDGGDSPTTGA